MSKDWTKNSREYLKRLSESKSSLICIFDQIEERVALVYYYII